MANTNEKFSNRQARVRRRSEEHCERSPAAFRTSLVGAHLCAGDR